VARHATGREGARPSGTGASKDRREGILTAAERLFAERGYEHVSVRDVAAAAGVTHPLLYYHWGSKRELLAAVLKRNQERVRGLVAGQTDPRETITAIITSYLTEGRLYLLIMARSFLGGMPATDWPGGYPGLEAAIRVLRAAGPVDDPRWDEEVRGVVSLVTAMLCGWVLMGEEIMDPADVRPPQRERAPERLLAAIDGLLREALAARERPGPWTRDGTRR
jgi:AcrR family transcriptional regulator